MWSWPLMCMWCQGWKLVELNFHFPTFLNIMHKGKLYDLQLLSFFLWRGGKWSLFIFICVCNLDRTYTSSYLMLGFISWRWRKLPYSPECTKVWIILKYFMCVFTTSGSLGKFLNARFSSRNWFVGTLEAHLITIEIFGPYTYYKQCNRPFSNTEIHLGWPCFLPTLMLC